MMNIREAIWIWACVRMEGRTRYRYIETHDVVVAFGLDVKAASRHLRELARQGCLRPQQTKNRYGKVYHYYPRPDRAPVGRGNWDRLSRRKTPSRVPVGDRIGMRGGKFRYVNVEVLPVVRLG